jgi:hypothetical protein
MHGQNKETTQSNEKWHGWRQCPVIRLPGIGRRMQTVYQLISYFGTVLWLTKIQYRETFAWEFSSHFPMRNSELWDDWLARILRTAASSARGLPIYRS